MHRNHYFRQVCCSFLVFLVMMWLLLGLVAKTEEQTVQEQKKFLKSAIERSMVQCFITKGRYPESFLYLEENYGIVYDRKKFKVDYQFFGANLRPKVTIIILGDKN